MRVYRLAKIKRILMGWMMKAIQTIYDKISLSRAAFMKQSSGAKDLEVFKGKW
jgi:hypothetical protein